MSREKLKTLAQFYRLRSILVDRVRLRRSAQQESVEGSEFTTFCSLPPT
jgi:hypothetical protein